MGTNGTDEAGFQFQYRGSENILYLLSNGSPIASTQGSLFGSTVLTAARDSQNVGIGKAPSTTHKLDVNGSIACNNIISSGTSSSFISTGDADIKIGTSSLSYGVQNVYFYHGSSSLNVNKYIGAVGAALDNGTGGRLIFQTPTPAGEMNGRMRIDSAGLVGIGKAAVAPFQLDLSTDGARKLTNTTWTTGSDNRIKKNIETANYDLLYNTVKQLDLKYFEWDFNDENINSTINDKHSIGFIAQEVKQYYPKAVDITDETERFGIQDFHNLNVDQLNKCMYGALKKAIHKIENLENDFDELRNENNELRNDIKVLQNI